MVVRISLIALFFLYSTCVMAGNIYGTIVGDRGPLPVGTPVEVRCGESSYFGNVREAGSYSVYVRGPGACMLSILGASHPVYSYPNPSQYNFELRMQDGSHQLMRR